jgi:outer membrane lipoprotein-sorting protein
MFDYHLAGTERLRGQPVYVLEGTWKSTARTNSQVAAMAAFTGKTRLYVGQQDGFVHKMEQFDRSNTNLFMTMEMSNLKFNQAVPDNLFAYHPPADVQVMDMTQTAGAFMGGPAVPPPAASSAPPPAPEKPASPPQPSR